MGASELHKAMTLSSPPPSLHPRPQPDGSLELAISGSWIHGTELPELPPARPGTDETMPKRVRLVAEDLGEWDSRLPIALIRLIDGYRQAGAEVDFGSLPEGVQGLLRLAYAVPERAGARRRERRVPIVEQVGKVVLHGLGDALDLVRFIGETTLALAALARGAARFRAADLAIAIQAAGPSALAIVTLISLLVGLILAFVGAAQLSLFGAQIFIADLVGLGMVREMGPLMTAILMAGRTGASYAAQLGTMNVNSEIDALKTMGISPVEFLVLPRMLALVLMMPLLGVYADFMGILGGAVIGQGVFDLNSVQFLHGVDRAVDLYDFGIGIFKSLVFAVLIATAGCMRGMRCGRSASAVGDAATSAVVDGIVYIVVADSIITLLCNRLDI